MSSKEMLVLPDELFGRLDNLFEMSDEHSVEDLTTLEVLDTHLAKDLRYLIPALPEFAEYKLRLSQQKKTGLRRILGNFSTRRVVLSDDFKRETFTRHLEISEMAMIQLNATKRSYLGAIAVGDNRYSLEPGSAVYRLTETFWADWHGDRRLDVTVVSPTKKLLISERSLTPPGLQKSLNNQEKSEQLQNLDNLLLTFGY